MKYDLCCPNTSYFFYLFYFIFFTRIQPQLYASGFNQAATYIYGELSITCFTVTHSRCSSLSKDFIMCQTVMSLYRPQRDTWLTRKTFTTVLVAVYYVDMFSLTLAHVQMRTWCINSMLFSLYVLEWTAFQIKCFRRNICLR